MLSLALALTLPPSPGMPAAFWRASALTEELGEGDVEKMLLKLDPWNNDSVTTSDLYLALVPGLADDDGDAASEAFAGKGSSIFALGGVGHGELFVGTYEGNKFKPMYR